jgi:hypothetical protein
VPFFWNVIVTLDRSEAVPAISAPSVAVATEPMWTKGHDDFNYNTRKDGRCKPYTIRQTMFTCSHGFKTEIWDSGATAFGASYSSLKACQKAWEAGKCRAWCEENTKRGIRRKSTRHVETSSTDSSGGKRRRHENETPTKHEQELVLPPRFNISETKERVKAREIRLQKRRRVITEEVAETNRKYLANERERDLKADIKWYGEQIEILLDGGEKARRRDATVLVSALSFHIFVALSFAALSFIRFPPSLAPLFALECPCWFDLSMCVYFPA